MLFALISGVLFGLFYAFMSTGLNLLAGVLRLVNLAHGDIVVFGAYLAYSLATTAHMNPLWAIPISVIPAMAFGVLLYYGFIPRLSRSEDTETTSLILFFGVSQVLEAIATFAYGNNQMTINPGTFTFGAPVHFLGENIPRDWVWCGFISIPALALLFFFLYKTRLGLATRAFMASSEEAVAAGINTKRVAALAFGIGIAFAAAAGPLALFMLGGVEPDTGGSTLVLIAFTVIVIGSLGNPLGTVIGGLLYGLAYQLTSVYASSWATIVPYALMLIVLLTRPQGILGKKVRSA